MIRQNAYLYMLIEYHLLAIGGDPAREAIRRLKQQGLKTEPAFAEYFGLDGDPYLKLPELARMDDEPLRSFIAKTFNKSG